jgi:hypothetical protein
MAKYKIDRRYKDETDLVFSVKFPQGKTIANVEDAIFIIKRTDEAVYGAKLFEKTIIGGGITILNPNLFNVRFIIADYTTMTIGESYRASLFCKWTGDSDYDENVEQIYDFEIIQDFHNP